MIRVLLVEDQALYRTGLRLIIDAEPDMEVAGEAADGALALEAVGRLQVDVVLMDVRRSGADDLEAARLLVEASGPRPVRVLVLASLDVEEHVERALEIGVSGVVLKSASTEELAYAIRTVAAGGAFLDPLVTQRVIDAFSRRGLRRARMPDQLATLSRREREVLLHLARGLSNREVARSLGVGEATVRTHVGRMLMKLNVRDRTQAVVLAYRSGIVE